MRRRPIAYAYATLTILVLLLLALLAFGCATPRESALRYGYAVRVSAEMARDTTTVMHKHELVSDTDCARIEALYKQGKALSVRYAEVVAAMPVAAAWTPQDVVAVQLALDALLHELETMVEAAIKEVD